MLSRIYSSTAVASGKVTTTTPNCGGEGRADLLAPVNAEPADEMDEAALVATIDAALQGTSPVSEVLLAERHEGP